MGEETGVGSGAVGELSWYHGRARMGEVGVGRGRESDGFGEGVRWKESLQGADKGRKELVEVRRVALINAWPIPTIAGEAHRTALKNGPEEGGVNKTAQAIPPPP